MEPFIDHVFSETLGGAALSFSPDQSILCSVGCEKIKNEDDVTEDKETLYLWDLDSKKIISEFKGHDEYCYSVDFSPDGRLLVSGSEDSSVRFWKVQSSDGDVSIMDGHTDLVNSVRFSKTGKHVISASDDGTLRVWEVENLKEDSVLEECHVNQEDDIRSIWGAEFINDSDDIFATGGDDGCVKLWDRRLKEPNFQTMKEGELAVLSVNQDSNYIASGGGKGSVMLYDMRTYKKVFSELKYHDGSVEEIGFHHSHKYLISAAGDNLVKIMDIPCLKVIFVSKKESEVICGVQFSPDGTYFATGGEKLLKLWRFNHISSLSVQDNKERKDFVQFSLEEFGDERMKISSIKLNGDELFVVCRLFLM